MFLICFLNFEDHIFNLFPAMLRFGFISFFCVLVAETAGQLPAPGATGSEGHL